MIVANRKMTRQFELFDLNHERGITIAACRNYTGEFFEEATAFALKGDRIVIDSRAEVCPDVKIGASSFVEVKSVGRSAAAMAYQGRLEKDRAFIAETGSTLYYALWNHSYRCRSNENLDSLRAGLARSVKSLTLIEFEAFYSLMTAGPVMVLNKANDGKRSRTTGERRGYGSFGYTNGFRLRLSKIHEGAERSPVTTKVKAFGKSLKPFDLIIVDRNEAISEVLRRSRLER